jgi:hypothetical protein
MNVMDITDANLKILKAATEDLLRPTEARRHSEMIGAFLYLSTGTRPDIVTPVGMLARYMVPRFWEILELRLLLLSRSIGVRCFGLILLLLRRITSTLMSISIS